MNTPCRLSSVAYVAVLVALQIFAPHREQYAKTDSKLQAVPSPAVQRASAAPLRDLYDPNPDHIWNRLYRGLFIRVGRDGREYGYDALDPLLWSETKYLLSGPSNKLAIKLLDEFLETGAERLIKDPLKRAILQRDLWAVFDWSTLRSYEQTPEKRELQIKLAQVIRRTALSKQQIESLPNSYIEAVAAKTFADQYDSSKPQVPFLPPDLFQKDGPWVALSKYGGDATALDHVFGFSGRSAFRVFIRLPGGREATLNYLKKLESFPQQWLREIDSHDPDRVLPNPATPQFPLGTQLALVREMMLIDDQANLRPTRLAEDVQIRIHRAIPTTIPDGVDLDSNEALSTMNVFEFKLSRARIFASVNGGLRAVAQDEKEFRTFHSHGIDPFDPRPDTTPIERHMSNVLNSCALCHFRPGIHSVLSRGGFTRPRGLAVAWSENHEADATMGWKQGRYDWGLLRGFWELQPTAQRR
jgi:hypothetical protein